jgi:hypothetical protein
MSDPFKLVERVPFKSPGDAGLDAGVAVHTVKAYSEPVPQKDYSGWLTAHEVAELLCVSYRTGWTLGKKYMKWERVCGRILYEPASAMAYKRIHDITRRPPVGR